MKYFCVSDIHGHYDVLIASLKEKGWDPDNMGHKLIVIGDMVDNYMFNLVDRVVNFENYMDN